MLDTSKIKAITLDLDETLWPIVPVIVRAERLTHSWLQTYAPQVAQRFDIAALRSLREQLQAQNPVLKIDLLQARRETLLEAFSQSGAPTDLAHQALAIFVQARSEVALFDDVVEALQSLSSRWQLFALSNGFANIHVAGIGQYFVGALSASDVGIAKPDIRIFNLAAEKLCLTPSQILHVGDDRALDYDGAIAAGMQAYWINRPHTSMKSLADLLLHS